jgi:outer membrane protein OmpA-like peptidoglycan-associated protein
MSIDQTIRRDSASYRQGVVLGLTMAETLLLLVFCLLIAAASIFSHKVMQVKALEEENANLTASLKDTRARYDLLQSNLQGNDITDDWKRIVRDYGPAIQKMEEAGVPIKEAADAADVVAAAVKAHRTGATAGELTQSITLQRAITQEFSSSAEVFPTNEQVTSLIREGLQIQTASAKEGSKGRHDWPPIITLSEADGHYFDTGIAVLKPDFRKDLSGPIIEQLLAIIRDYPDVNVIEVIGHTDEQPLVRRPSNLDELLMPVLRRKSQVKMLEPADNAGLGLARAVSVSQVLLQDERLSSRFAILPYSGAQLVNVNDSLVLSGIGGDVKERRRIEIRLRKSNRVGLPIASPAPRLVPPKPTTAAVPSRAPSLPTISEADTALAQPNPRPPAAEAIKPKPRRETGGVKTPFGWFFRN